MIIQPPSGLPFCPIWIEKCPNKNPCFVSGLYAWKELNKLHLEWSKWSIFLTVLLVDNGWYLKTQVLPLSILLPHTSVLIQLYQPNSKTDLPKRQLSLLSSSRKQQLPVSHTDNTSLDILSIFIISISQNRPPSYIDVSQDYTCKCCFSCTKPKSLFRPAAHEHYFSYSLTPCNISVSYRAASDTVRSSTLDKAQLLEYLRTSFPLKINPLS